MAKVAMIGAGSLVFCKTLMSDFLATPALAGSEYRLMALTHRRLDRMRDFVRRMIKDNGVDASVAATTSRREALKGADYVVVMIQAGGVKEFAQDYGIPMKYGVDQCIGDTMGPGGVFRVMRHFSYFMTESTGHLSEYLPYFRKNRKALDAYCDEPAFGGESGAYYKYCRMLDEKFRTMDPLSIESTKLGKRSAEYCSHIIEAVETGIPFRFNGNVRNDGFITNLPSGCCVEVPVYADRNGLHPSVIGELPPQCAALNMTNVLVQGLTVEASFTGDPELVMQAVALDPLTSAVLTLEEIRRMVGEMLEAGSKHLPQFKGRRLKPVPVISVPENVKRKSVPLDPALAIANRFGKLAGV